MKLKQLSLTFIASALSALAVNAWMLFDIHQQQLYVEQLMEQRHASIRLTKQNSNDIHYLSQFVRAYTSTGESRYLMYYYDLIAIRKGIKPAPENYDHQYWYEVLSGKRVHLFERKQSKVSNSLQQQLINLAFSREEIQHLEQILTISDKMSKIEQIAFAATQGLYDPSTKTLVDEGEPQMAFAIQLVNSPDYLQLNNQLIYEVDALLNQTALRTQQQEQSAQFEAHQAIFYAIISIIISILLLFSMGYIVFGRVLRPIGQLVEASDKLQYHQYASRAYISKSVFELDQLARNFNEMAANIEADIMHRTYIEHQLTHEKNKVQEIYQQIQDSIKSASLIQQALTPRDESMSSFFREQMHIWQPKDVVGGDIYFFTNLRNEEESLLMVIDCTGHGVPGAFLTMLIKAIHQQIITNLKHRHGEISPAKILAEFNATLKHLLKQDEQRPEVKKSMQDHHDVGFDGAIIYCDKERNLVRFAGAHTPLFYLNGADLNVIKGDRQSIGYHNSHADFEFTDYDLIATPYTVFYLTTDGYLDQNGGDKGLPFGKKRLQKMITDYGDRSLTQQQVIFLRELQNYQLDEHQTDDITLLAFRL